MKMLKQFINEHRDDISVCTKFLLGVMVLFCILWVIVYVAGYKACHSKYADFSPEYVGTITGCMVEYEETRVPAESLVFYR